MDVRRVAYGAAGKGQRLLIRPANYRLKRPSLLSINIAARAQAGRGKNIP